MDTRLDVLHFINSRKWEKKLSLEGDEFIIFPNLGTQPKNILDQQNSSGIHWWFWEKCFAEEINLDKESMKVIMRNPIKFNCLVTGTSRKLDYDALHKRFDNLDDYLLTKYSVSDNIETLAMINSTEQIERAIAIIDMLKVKLNWKIEQLSSEASESYELEPVEEPQVHQPQICTPADRLAPKRTISAMELREIMGCFEENTPPKQSKTFLERISPRFARKNKSEKT